MRRQNPRARLLLVEDNRTNQEVALAMLGQMGMQVDVADNGKQALEQLEQKDYDLVLMDVQMPIMDGIALALQVGSAFPDVTIVLMTGYIDAVDPLSRMTAQPAALFTSTLRPCLE